jgi:hypothetical protein
MAGSFTVNYYAPLRLRKPALRITDYACLLNNLMTRWIPVALHNVLEFWRDNCWTRLNKMFVSVNFRKSSLQ